MCSFTKAILIVLLAAGAASAQDQALRPHNGPIPDATPGLPEAVHAACPSPPPSSTQDYNAKRSLVNAERGAVNLSCSNVAISCLETSYKILPTRCKAALVDLECVVAGLRPPKKLSSP
jgi:hypothetical protein